MCDACVSKRSDSGGPSWRLLNGADLPEAGVAGVAHEGAELFFGGVEAIAAGTGLPGAIGTVDDVV